LGQAIYLIVDCRYPKIDVLQIRQYVLQPRFDVIYGPSPVDLSKALQGIDYGGDH